MALTISLNIFQLEQSYDTLSDIVGHCLQLIEGTSSRYPHTSERPDDRANRVWCLKDCPCLLSVGKQIEEAATDWLTSGYAGLSVQ